MELKKIKKVLNKKISYIGLDIDDKDLLQIQLDKIKKLFPNTEYAVWETTKGYHIKIYKQVSILENILYRAILFDDPARLAMSLRRFFIYPSEKGFDVLFNIKNGKKFRKVIK